jgi:hypothetical protein
MKYVLFFLFYCLLACNEKTPQASGTDSATPSTEEQLVGEWRNTYLKVTMPSHKATDTSAVLEVTEATWQEQLKIQPIRTFFRPDGTYNSEHRKSNDSIVYNPAGKWFVRNDTLHMTDTFPKRGITYKFKVGINDRIAEFRGLLDWDADGKEDDEYLGRQRRQ